MITVEQWRRTRERSVELLAKAGIVLTPAEQEELEVADFGFGRLETFGLQIVIYINTERVCAKELVMFPWQICPEHRHPPVGGAPGKEETFRCRWGEVYLYVPGSPSEPLRARLPTGEHAPYLQVRHEIVLRPGEQYTLYPQTLHWFQAGPQGAVVSEFSTHSSDESDIFTDPAVQREPIVQRS